jgi:hypothetical protein
MTYLSAGQDYYCLCQSLQQQNSCVSDPHWPFALRCPHSHLVQTLPQSLQEAPLQLSAYVSTLPHSMVFAHSILKITFWLGNNYHVGLIHNICISNSQISKTSKDRLLMYTFVLICWWILIKEVSNWTYPIFMLNNCDYTLH